MMSDTIQPRIGPRSSPRGKTEQWTPAPLSNFPNLVAQVANLVPNPFPLGSAPLLFLTLLWSHHAVAWSSAAAFWEWTETFERASCSLCHRLQGLDSNLPSSFPSVLPHSSLLSLSLTTPHWTVELHRYEYTAYVNFPCGHPPYICTVSNMQVLHRDL